MIIDHFNGTTHCQNDAEIAALLAERDEQAENEFWLSHSGGFPCLVLSVSADLACLHYFADENDPGCQSSGYGKDSGSFDEYDPTGTMSHDQVRFNNAKLCQADGHESCLSCLLYTSTFAHRLRYMNPST